MGRLGTITFQANGKEDIFLQEDLFHDAKQEQGEIFTEIPEPGFDTERAWATGWVPSIHKVDVEGDAILLKGWIRTDGFTGSFKVMVYVECEETEEVEKEPEA